MKLVEPIAVVDCYADGLGAVQLLKGGNVRLIMYVEQENEAGVMENVVVQKTVVPMPSIPEYIALLWAVTSGAIVRTVTGFLPNFH